MREGRVGEGERGEGESGEREKRGQKDHQGKGGGGGGGGRRQTEGICEEGREEESKEGP